MGGRTIEDVTIMILDRSAPHRSANRLAFKRRPSVGRFGGVGRLLLSTSLECITLW